MLRPTLWITHPGDHRTYGIVTDTLELPQCLYNIEKLEAGALSNKILDIYDNRDEIVRTLQTTIPKAEKTTMLNGEYFKRNKLY